MRRFERRFKRAARFGALIWLCALLALGPAALAESPAGEEALEIECAIRPETMVAPGEASLTFVLVNRTGQPIQNITLTSDDGLLSEPIGQIAPGEKQTLVRPHTVTQEEFDDGFIRYTVTHDALDPGGAKVSHALDVPVSRTAARPGVEFTRQLAGDAVAQGGLLTVTYKIRNTGNVALGALRIRDTLGDFTGRLERLDVDETKTFISRVTITGETESAPSLEYAAPDGETVTLALDPLPIRIAESRLELAFSVGRSVFEAGTADAILTLTNPGNADCTGITVTDDVYGGVIADALTVPGGGSPVEVAYTYPLRGEGEYRWRVTGVSGTGEAIDLRTDTVSLSDAPAEAAIALTLAAGARTPKINRAGRVTFDFSIANAGTVMAQDALLYEVSRGEIRRLAVLPIGDPIALSASYDVDASAQFIFCLNYEDAQGHPRTISTAPIEVEIAPDGVPPETDDGEGIDLEGEPVKMTGNSSTFVVLLIIAGAALTVMFTILLIASVRARRERRQRIAAEKQRIKEEMGKTNPFTPVKATTRKKK